MVASGFIWSSSIYSRQIFPWRESGLSLSVEWPTIIYRHPCGSHFASLNNCQSSFRQAYLAKYEIQFRAVIWLLSDSFKVIYGAWLLFADDPCCRNGESQFLSPPSIWFKKNVEMGLRFILFLEMTLLNASDQRAVRFVNIHVQSAWICDSKCGVPTVVRQLIHDEEP